MALAEYDRQTWLDRKFDYRPGQSVMIIGPTGGGKTVMAWQISDVALRQNPELSLTALQPKPADESTIHYANEFGLKISPSYPFKKKWYEQKPSGYVHWPAHIKNDEDANTEHLSNQFKQSLGGEYWRGNKIVLLDDTFIIGAQLKCNKLIDKYLTAGRSNDVGLIGCLQQPRGTVSSGSIGSFAYSQPAHLIFLKETGKANLSKLADIGMGMDTEALQETVRNLRSYSVNDSLVSDALHLDRRGYASIVTPW